MGLMMRSMLATLFVSDGIPCISAGDEYGHTRGGSQPAPAAFKNTANAFRWDAMGDGTAGTAIKRFVASLAVRFIQSHTRWSHWSSPRVTLFAYL